MIITNLIGGLGNQMFQYAAGRSLSMALNTVHRLSIDQFGGTYQDHNGFELAHVFDIPSMALASDLDLKHTLGWRSEKKIRRIVSHLPRAFKGARWLDEAHVESIASRVESEDFYLHGYWQSEKYFHQHAAQIRKDFLFKGEMSAMDQDILWQMRHPSSVSVHVRRGDYVSPKNQSIYHQANEAYYRAAMGCIRERVPHARFFFFSDDPGWVKAELMPCLGPMTVVSHNAGKAAANDMRLMMHADHHIIANSTFSWWAAWLNDKPQKTVVAPRHWYVDENRGADILPQDWIRI